MTPLFRQLLGSAFDALPPAVRRLHEAGGGEYAGHARVCRGPSFASRLLGALAGLPPARDSAPLAVRIRVDEAGETWERRFAGRTMRSRLTARDGLLREQLGAATFRFALEPVPGGIAWRLRAVHALGVIPLPLAWFRRVEAREYERDARYAFEVHAEAALAGLVVRYEGSLDPVAAAP